MYSCQLANLINFLSCHFQFTSFLNRSNRDIFKMFINLLNVLNTYVKPFIYLFYCSCDSLSELATHLREQHGKKSDVNNRMFETIDAFLEWKKSVEKETNSWYVQHRAKRKGKHYTTWWYYCNRTGNERTISPGKERRKCRAHQKQT